jgi:hypothetical protein
MTWPTIPFKPHVPRCPVCNKYLPDRCTCNGMSIEQRRNAAPLIDEMTDIEFSSAGLRDLAAKLIGTGRLRSSEPVEYVTTKHGVERRHKGVAIDIETALPGEHPFIAMDFGDAEMRVLAGGWVTMGKNGYIVHGNPPRAAPRSDSPAGWRCGTFTVSDGSCLRFVSGNARQRRRQIRAWKREGLTVTQFNVATGERITR